MVMIMMMISIGVSEREDVDDEFMTNFGFLNQEF